MENRICGVIVNVLDFGTVGRVVDLISRQNQLDLGTIGHVVDLRSG
jgi:hypothetical protein